jgi:NADH-quinone oxidoreductase subunit M
MDHFPWLSAITFVPLAGAVLLALFPARAVNLARLWSLAVTLIAFVLSLLALAHFDGGRAGFQLVDRATWVGPLNMKYLLGVDGISLFMVLLTTFLMPLGVLVSWRVEHRVKAFMMAFLALETAMIGSFVALDLLLFFFFFEGLLFPMYLIIGGWGSQRRLYAAVKFFLYTMAGSAFMLVAILFLYFKAGSSLGHPTFVYTELQRMQLPALTARWLWAGFFVAFAVKAPLVPVHTWLPDAHTEAPTAGSLALAAVVIKVGTYGLIRFNVGLFPEASSYFRTLVLTLAVIGIVYGGVVSIVQRDVKRLVAYSSVSHIGFVVLGIFAFTIQGMSGGVLQMVNHGLSTGALFLMVGMLYDRTHTREVSRYGGLASAVPVLAGVLLFFMLSSMGLPGLNGFVGEFLIVLGTFIVSKPFAVVAVTGVVLAAIYLLWLYQRMMYGPLREQEHGPLRDLSAREYAIVAPLVAAVLLIGVFPKPLLERIEPAARRAVACAQDRGASAGTALLPGTAGGACAASLRAGAASLESGGGSPGPAATPAALPGGSP